MRRLAITPGEPAGIGPEIVVRACQSNLAEVEWVTVADRELLATTASQLGLPLDLHPFDPAAPRPSGGGHLTVAHVPLAEPAVPGRLNPANAGYVLECLARASDLCSGGALDALVTGPVHKAVINESGLPFSGHTEFFAQRAGVGQVVMMLATEGLRVALATTHLPLKDVPAAITHAGLTRTLEILHHDLISKFGLPAPRILVAGLNPHAGEGGHLGREELEIIEPVLNQLRARGMQLVGPLPADTLFTPKYLSGADAVLAMYHDQGLPVLKFKGFGRASNITLGLPYIRTSVDHGTALDLAGRGVADLGSFFEALHAAERMARTRLC